VIAVDENTLAIGPYVFPVKKATFRYITDNGQGGSGWEFDIRATPIASLSTRNQLFGQAPRFFAEGDPIPLPNVRDLTGTELYLKEPFDPESGQVYFTLYVFEHGDVTNLRLKFLKKKDRQYRIAVTATVPAGLVFARSRPLRIETWIKQLPARKYGAARAGG
jgi:hypothetical protein